MTHSETNAVAIVTGISRGFGLALTAALLDRGWTVVGDARRAVELETAAGELNSTRLIALPGDVTLAAHRAALLDAATGAGRLGLLVNNASRLGPSPQPALPDYPVNELRAVYEANVFAPLALIQAALPALTGNSGAVVNLSSDAAVGALSRLGRIWLVEGRAGSALGRAGRRGGRPSRSTPSTRATCAPRCTRPRSPARTSPTVPEPASVVPALLRLLDDRPASGRYRAAGRAGVGGCAHERRHRAARSPRSSRATPSSCWSLARAASATPDSPTSASICDRVTCWW